jgi:lipoate-protein ligase A
MPILISPSNDPYFNLALEEYLLRSNIYYEDIFLLWHSKKAFVFGRNQNPFIEINPVYFDKGIPMIRRISGGGTVYHDANTINFSFITKEVKNKINNYQYFLKPITSVLNHLGCKAYFKPKSHLFVDQYKISGNAQAYINGKLLHHGTLLFNTDLSIIDDALVKYNSFADGIHVLSNKSDVRNIKDYLVTGYTMQSLENDIIKEVVEYLNIEKIVIDLTNSQLDEIVKIAQNKYNSWEWNFGKTKKFVESLKISDELIDIEVDHGIITKVSSNVYNKLVNLRFQSKEYFEELSIIIKNSCD